jgi:DNA polymerase eta
LLSLENPQRAYLSPLAVIAHIDVNAFFAQVEQIRLGLSKEDAVVCVQWSSLIAVSYAARDYGIGRMDNVETAKLKCEKLIPVHTAVFKKGENFWRYRDEDKEPPSPVNHKVSLDPYRRESRKIMKIFKSNCDLVEKASVDESFMDLGRIVLKRLYALLPDLEEQLEKMDKLDQLPPVPQNLKFETHGFIVSSVDEPENGPKIYDWDDLVILLGSLIAHEIRQQIEKELGYTTSCGVARVKTVAKLASGFKKPDNQTIVRNGSINQFLSNFDFTELWSMGGKTGEYIKSKLSPSSSDSMTYIRENYDMDELKEYLEDEQLSEKLYLMVRGEYAAPLSERILLKSMNSNKNIRGSSGSSFKDSCEWIKVFAADLYQRLMETDDENGYKTRARTLSIKFKSKNNFSETHSKQCSLPIVPKEELEETLYKYGVNLLKMLEAQYHNIYPLVNLNMTISNFEIMDKASSNIMNFVKRGDVSSIFKNAGESKIKREQGTSGTSGTEVSGADTHYIPLDDGKFQCTKCGNEVQDQAEHRDFHYAIEITEQLNGASSLSSELQRYSAKKLSYGESRLNLRSMSPSTSSTKRKKVNTKPDKKVKVTKGQSRLPF